MGKNHASAFVALALLTSCTDIWSIPATVSPKVDCCTTSDIQWKVEVGNAMALWNHAFEKLGCKPVFFWPAEHEHGMDVRLVDNIHGRQHYAGWADQYGIQVLETSGRDDILLHEFGHVLGLEHDEDFSRPSIMWAVVNTATVGIQPIDALRATENYCDPI